MTRAVAAPFASQETVMEYVVIWLLGLACGLLTANTLWKWKLTYKARTGQRLEADGDLFVITKETHSV